MASDAKPVPGAEVVRWRKKPVVIEAMEWDGTEACLQRALAFIDIASLPKDGAYVNPGIGYTPMMGTLEIPTLEGTITASPGDYIIRGVKGEFYPCRADIFEMTYEKVDDAALRASPEPAAPSADATAACEHSRDCVRCGKRIAPAFGVCFACHTEGADATAPLRATPAVPVDAARVIAAFDIPCAADADCDDERACGTARSVHDSIGYEHPWTPPEWLTREPAGALDTAPLRALLAYLPSYRAWAEDGMESHGRKAAFRAGWDAALYALDHPEAARHLSAVPDAEALLSTKAASAGDER